MAAPTFESSGLEPFRTELTGYCYRMVSSGLDPGAGRGRLGPGAGRGRPDPVPAPPSTVAIGP